MHQDWEVRITERPGSFLFDVFIYRQVGEKIEIMEGDTISNLIDPHEAVKPSFSLLYGQLRAFAGALNTRGINPEKEFTVGKLEATEAHLQDMRTLLKLK